MLRIGLKCYPFIITVDYEWAEMCARLFYVAGWALGNVEAILSVKAVRVEDRAVYLMDEIPVEVRRAA